MEELNLNTYNNGKAQLRAHKITVSARKNCSITGVKDVLSFDVNEVLLETEQGMLMIKGAELHVNRLSLEKGEVDVDGSIDSFTYSDETGMKEKAESFFARLFQ